MYTVHVGKHEVQNNSKGAQCTKFMQGTVPQGMGTDTRLFLRRNLVSFVENESIYTNFTLLTLSKKAYYNRKQNFF